MFHAIFSLWGAKVNFHVIFTLGSESSGERVPGSESTRERKFHSFALGSESMWEQKFQLPLPTPTKSLFLTLNFTCIYTSVVRSFVQISVTYNVVVAGAFRVEMKRCHRKDRTVLCCYNPTECGLYTINIRWSGVDVPGSPFYVNVCHASSELERYERIA